MALDKILTTTAGSLPRTAELLSANAQRMAGAYPGGQEAFDEFLRMQVDSLVKRQAEVGLDIVGDGEYGKSMSTTLDYGAWWTYSFDRTSGLALDPDMPSFTEAVQSAPGHTRLTGFFHRRDRALFSEAYSDPDSGISFGNRELAFPKAVEAIGYTGQGAVKADISNLLAGMKDAGIATGFLTALSPGSASRITNDYYATDEEWVYAWADVLREEYTAIVDAGLTVQIDDPSVAENFDQITPAPSIEDYVAFTKVRVDALNYALRGLPEDQIRFHLCWGSWHGPHVTDIPMADIVDTMLTINAGSYSFEAGNVRHEHEWRVWDDVKLPEGKQIVPGVVSHATNVVEHPRVVADRIIRFADRVGRENVIASTDCGLGGRIHQQIAWAKLASLVEGAKIATAELWG